MEKQQEENTGIFQGSQRDHIGKNAGLKNIFEKMFDE